VQQPVNALLISPDPLFVDRRAQLAALALRYSLPAIYPFREDAEAGGLMSYGASNTDIQPHALCSGQSIELGYALQDMVFSELACFVSRDQVPEELVSVIGQNRTSAPPLK
jgi:hypothetical protein